MQCEIFETLAKEDGDLLACTVRQALKPCGVQVSDDTRALVKKEFEARGGAIAADFPDKLPFQCKFGDCKRKTDRDTGIDQVIPNNA